MSKPGALTAGAFFTHVKQCIEKTCNVTITDDARLDGLCADTNPLHSDSAKRALKTTARMALGKGHRMALHSHTEAEKVAAQVILVAQQRHADLDGKTPLPELLAHGFATLGLSYAYGSDDRTFGAIVKGTKSSFFCPTEIPVLA